MPAEATHRHGNTTKLDHHILTACEIGHALFPDLHDFVLFARVRANTERSANMVQDDGCIRKRMGQINQVGKLGMIHPGVETQAKLV